MRYHAVDALSCLKTGGDYRKILEYEITVMMIFDQEHNTNENRKDAFNEVYLLNNWEVKHKISPYAPAVLAVKRLIRNTSQNFKNYLKHNISIPNSDNSWRKPRNYKVTLLWIHKTFWYMWYH